MQNFVQAGDCIRITAPYAAPAGGLIHIGELVGVTFNPAVPGSETDVSLTGVYRVNKPALEAWAAGQIVYLMLTDRSLTSSTGADRVKAGHVWRTATAGTNTAEIKLLG